MTMTEAADTFPGQQAATRRFRLGLPRGFRISPDGRQVCFIRSTGGRDPVDSLWIGHVAGEQFVERCVVDARALEHDAAHLPEAERARRERLRETTIGITAYSTDDALSCAVFSVDGVPYLIDLRDEGARVRELPHPGAVTDPQVSPDGTWVTFVSDRAVWLVSSTAAAAAVALVTPDDLAQSWGLADFVAAEELQRYRGLWWLPGSEALLVELVDENPVETRWIADPAHPEREPIAHRYPAAGTANPIARLFLVRLDGTRTELAWDRESFPYLATVDASDPRAAIIRVLSRDQTRQLILRLDPGTSEAVLLRERIGTPWLTMMAGVPSLAADGSLLEIVANTVDDCFQLVADDQPLSPPDVNVTGVVDASGDHIVVTGTDDPLERHVYERSADGRWTRLSDGHTVASATGRSGAMVLTSADAAEPVIRFEARLTGGTAVLPSSAERPVVRPQATFQRVGQRHLATAVLWPTGHVPGSRRLPVLMSPYGGPHVAEVVRSAAAMSSDQWLADQGFAVVIVDGRGTPGRGPAWEYAIAGDLSGVVLQDQVDALEALGELHPDLDLSRVGVRGWSFGGYLSALAVLDRPDVFHAAVAGAPVTDWRLYDTAYTERYLGLPQEHPDAYDAGSLVLRAATLTRPLLLIHGFADDNVLFAHTLQLSSALLAAGRSHSVLPLAGVSHMTPQEVVSANLLRLEAEFFATHLV